MAIIKPPAPRELAWRVLGLLNLYRLLVPLALAFLHWITPETTAVGWARPRLFVITDTLYFAFAIVMILALKQRWPSLRRQAWLHIFVDVAALTLILYSSGGVASGLGMLLVIPVGAISLLVRRAFVIAASRTVASKISAMPGDGSTQITSRQRLARGNDTRPAPPPTSRSTSPSRSQLATFDWTALVGASRSALKLLAAPDHISADGQSRSRWAWYAAAIRSCVSTADAVAWTSLP